MDQLSLNPQMAAAQPGSDKNAPGVRVHSYFACSCLSISFCFQLMATLKEGDQWQMWEFVRI